MVSIQMCHHFILLSGSLNRNKNLYVFFFGSCSNRELKRVAYHPIVFIITDNSSLSASNNPHLLFSLSIIDELKIEQIRFNFQSNEKPIDLIHVFFSSKIVLMPLLQLI